MIGINTAISAGVEGVHWAVAVSEIKKFVFSSYNDTDSYDDVFGGAVEVYGLKNRMNEVAPPDLLLASKPMY